jgi:hypothetical protein
MITKTKRNKLIDIRNQISDIVIPESNQKKINYRENTNELVKNRSYYLDLTIVSVLLGPYVIEALHYSQIIYMIGSELSDSISDLIWFGIIYFPCRLIVSFYKELKYSTKK